MKSRIRIIAAVLVAAAIGLGAWLWLSAGRESTDDAQVDAPVTQIAARVGGTITKVAVGDNQLVEPDAVLVELDPRDYQVAVDKARAELADAEATAIAAQSNVPITSTTAASNVTTARGSIVQAQGGIGAAERELDAARARLTTAQARLREAEATAAKAARDVERLRGLLAKDEVSQQQFDTLVAAADAQKAAARFGAVADRRSRRRHPCRREQSSSGARGRRPGARRAADGGNRAPTGQRDQGARVGGGRPGPAGAGESRPGRAEPAVHDCQGAGARRRLEEEPQPRTGRAGRPAAAGARADSTTYG